MEVSFSPNIVRELNALSVAAREEAIERIELFAEDPLRPSLKVHKLAGRLKGRFAFSVNYRTRIIFSYVGKPRRAYLHHIGGHEVYDR